MRQPRRHRVVVIGGGFGRLAAAKALRRPPVEVTLVDRQTHHLFQPLLYHVATGILSEGNVSAPLRDVLRHQGNARTVACTLLDRRWEIAYDSLIVAVARRSRTSVTTSSVATRRG
jgi:NADH:ubiquinone reductase (H+-translocating)